MFRRSYQVRFGISDAEQYLRPSCRVFMVGSILDSISVCSDIPAWRLRVGFPHTCRFEPDPDMACGLRLNSFLHFLLTGEAFTPEVVAAVRREISFTDAIAAHVAWKNQLEATLSLPPVAVHVAREVGDHRACMLGKWIMGPGHRRYGHLACFDEIRMQHERFHRLAGEIVELQHSRQFALAEKVLVTGFEDASHHIVKELRRFSELFGS